MSILDMLQNLLINKILLIIYCIILIFYPACTQDNTHMVSNADKADSQIEHLVSQLGSDFYQERSSARKQLNAIGEPAIPSLIQGLKSKNQRIRAYSAHILGNVGNIKTIPELERALYDEDEFVRKNAKEAIEKIKYRHK